MSASTIAGRNLLVAIAVSTVCAVAQAQTPPKQVVKPPVAQAWIDVATFSGFPMGGGMGGQGMMGTTLGALMGGGKNATAEFGYTQIGTAGRWMDVTLYTSRNTSLAEALQAVPAGTTARTDAQAADPGEAEAAAARRRARTSPRIGTTSRPRASSSCTGVAPRRSGPDSPRSSISRRRRWPSSASSSSRAARRSAARTRTSAGRCGRARSTSAPCPPAPRSPGSTRSRARACRRASSSTIPAAQDLMPEIKLRQTDKGSFIAARVERHPDRARLFPRQHGQRARART